MVDPTEHAQLLNRLALALAEYDSANPYHDDGPLIARARQAAGEIEGRQAPTDEEILACRSWSCHGPTFDSDLVQFGRDVLAQFGGGEVK